MQKSIREALAQLDGVEVVYHERLLRIIRVESPQWTERFFSATAVTVLRAEGDLVPLERWSFGTNLLLGTQQQYFNGCCIQACYCGWTIHVDPSFVQQITHAMRNGVPHHEVARILDRHDHDSN